MQELSEYLNFYFPISKADLLLIANEFKLTELKKGEYFHRVGHKCDKISFIKSGIIRIYRQIDNKEITQWISTQGHFVTDLASFNFQSDGTWNMVALTDCELFTIDRKAYFNLVNILPQWYEVEKLFFTRCFASLEERIFSQLYMSSEERFKNLLTENPELFNQVPLQYIASMLGITPETLSRLRAKPLRKIS